MMVAMARTTHRTHVANDDAWGSAPAEVDETPRYATDEEFRRAYQQEKPRWAELAERLK